MYNFKTVTLFTVYSKVSCNPHPSPPHFAIPIYSNEGNLFSSFGVSWERPALSEQPSRQHELKVLKFKNPEIQISISSNSKISNTRSQTSLERSVKIFNGGLRPVSQPANLTLSSNVDQDNLPPANTCSYICLLCIQEFREQCFWQFFYICGLISQ